MDDTPRCSKSEGRLRVKPRTTRNGVRHVPIEPALVQLLRRIKEGAGDDGSALVLSCLSSIAKKRKIAGWEPDYAFTILSMISKV